VIAVTPDDTGERYAIPDGEPVIGCDFVIGQNGTQPILSVTPRDGQGNLVQIPNGATVTFALKNRLYGTTGLTVNNAAAQLVSATDPETSVVYNKLVYTWLAADTATPGMYYGQFTVVLPASGGKEYVPQPAPILINIAAIVE
jgi:hypothetical protein